MARSSYQYETSPRKIEPEYTIKKRKNKQKIEEEERERKKEEQKEKERQKRLKLKQEKKKHHKNIVSIIAIFFVFLTISYRSSLITEKFNEIQDKKTKLATIEKTNGQLEVSIEGSLNLNNIEKSAEEKLGMQKLNNDQKVYITLNKRDYTESTIEEIKSDNESNWFEKLIDSLFN